MLKLLMVIFCIGVILIAVSCGEPELETDFDKFSYTIGYQVGTQLKKAHYKVDLDIFTMAIEDVFNENPIALSDTAMSKIFSIMQEKMFAEEQEAMLKEAGKNRAESERFLKQNAEKEGVVVLPSGLQYKVITEGTGRTPTIDDQVKANYKGTFIDGTEFDSSYKQGEPRTFRVNRIIKGWQEALQLMKEGAKWQLFVPPDLGYGPNPGRESPIPPYKLLIFEIELVEVIK